MPKAWEVVGRLGSVGYFGIGALEGLRLKFRRKVKEGEAQW